MAIVFMRHSVRKDMMHHTDDELHPWLDRHERPYDSPIVDFELPAKQASQFAHLPIAHVVTSPLRRCIQTAAVVCKSLGITSLVVDFGLTEPMYWVRQSRATSLAYLTLEEMQVTAGEGISITSVGGCNPPDINDEMDMGESASRFFDCIQRVRLHYGERGAVCVTHWFGLDMFAAHGLSPSRGIGDVKECGFVAAAADGSLIMASGVELKEL